MQPYTAGLSEDTLIVENGRIARRYRWNGGNLISEKIVDKRSGQEWLLDGARPDMLIPGAVENAGGGRLRLEHVAQTPAAPAHGCAEVTFSLGELEVRRVFRLYAGCPAIACDFYLRGRWPETPNGPVIMERIAASRPHLSLTCVHLSDVTDRCNNLVNTRTLLPYRHEETLTGNLLLVRDVVGKAGLFILKEAPSPDAQLYWPGFDFTCRQGELALSGLGVAPQDVQPDVWTRAYGFVTGVAGDDEYGLLSSLRSYQETSRTRRPGRDEMILLNTWGDRGQDTRIGEEFALAELAAAQRLGVSHFQLDDGWQAGRTLNSAFAGGTFTGMWERDGFWHVHPERFPRGLAPLVEKARQLGIQIGLWFQPSRDNSYENWRKDAAVLIDMYRTYGIRTFKIDGVDILDKRGESNFRAMLDAVMQATSYDTVFNLDITAGHRFGFHYFGEYGNLFLENRYTDMASYYPHWTLRNLWQLARYAPPQALQIEFLNKWRNAAKYGADNPLAPAHVPFDYCFAVTMMAQPLAWFEASHLPQEAYALAPLIATYRRHQEQIHAGQIFPIGEEPTGVGWTGFQSILDDGHGYVLVFRELNDRSTARLRLWNLAGRRVRYRHVLGHGVGVTTTVDAESGMQFSLPSPLSFALYEYSVA